MNKSSGYLSRQAEIETELSDIRDLLDETGVDDHSITSDICSDHGEIIANREVKILDNYLKQFGTDYDTMKTWMRDTHGI